MQATRSEQLLASRLRIGAGSQRGQVPRPCPPRPTLPNEIEWFEIAMNGLTLAFALPFRLRTFALTPVFFFDGIWSSKCSDAECGCGNCVRPRQLQARIYCTIRMLLRVLSNWILHSWSAIKLCWISAVVYHQADDPGERGSTSIEFCRDWW